MFRFGLAALLVIGFLTLPVAAQEAEFEPETVGVVEAIEPGPHVFAMRQDWHGASEIFVWSADTLDYQGNMPAGTTAQFTVSADGQTAYAVSAFLKRISYGEMEAVLQIYDVATLSVIGEVILPPKIALSAAYQPLLSLTADGRYALIQNATPATSVTIVDLEARTVLAEVPTPGCWSIHPALEGLKFTTLCGNGTFATVTFDAEGAYERRTSDRIFDPDRDPLFATADRAGDNLIFVSYFGTLHIVSDAGETAELVDDFNFAQDIEGDWAPGGYQVLGYNEANGILFVTMHSLSHDGSHKDASEEIWAVDVPNREVLYRSPAFGYQALTVTDGAVPVIYALSEEDGTVVQFEVDPEAKFAAKPLTYAGDAGRGMVVEFRP